MKINKLMKLIGLPILLLAPNFIMASQAIPGNVTVIVNNVGKTATIEFNSTSNSSWIPSGGNWKEVPKGPILPGSSGEAIFTWSVEDVNNLQSFGQAFTTAEEGYVFLVVSRYNGNSQSPFGINGTQDRCKWKGLENNTKVESSGVTGQLIFNINCDDAW